jgi:3-hydroxymyristoyl/3-hydroxydecanoyl-(acyl carrier protein) dehydratase
MNALDREIQDCMSQLTVGEAGDYAATFCFPSGFSGFRGHFPGRPVLPGACLVQAAVVLSAVRTSVRAGLKRVEGAEWFAPVVPGMTLRFACREHAVESGKRAITVSVTHGDTKVAALNLTVVAEPRREEKPA